MQMENKINTAKREFNEKVRHLHEEDLPAVNFSNSHAFIVLYEKMLEIEEKLDGLKFDQNKPTHKG
jgi:hypothetical protein